MKSRKATGLFILILSTALLIGSAVGIFASAESTQPAPEIISQNIVYGANLRFQFAIDADALGEGKTVTVNIYDKSPREFGAVLLDSTEAVYEDVSGTNLGIKNAYVATSDAAISALDYGTEYYAEAVCDGVAGGAVKYSAVEYFLTRLYREGENVTDIQRELYESAIAYGSAAQRVMNDPRTNVADYVFVAAEDGKVNGEESIVAPRGTEVTLSYTGADAGFAYYIDAEGNRLGSTATVGVNGTYKASFADFTFDDLSAEASFTPESMSSTGLKAITVTDGDGDVTRYAGLLYGNVGAVGRTYSFSVTDDARLRYSTPQGGTALALVNANNYEAGHNYSVFEADLQIELGKDSSGTQLTSSTWTVDLMENVGTPIYRMIFVYLADSGELEVCFVRNNTYEGVRGTESTRIRCKIANAGDYCASYNLRIENYFIDKSRDTVCIITVNGTPLWICDSRAIAYEGDCPTVNSDVAAYQNTDGVYVLPFGYYSVSAFDDTPKSSTTFKGIYINPKFGDVSDICFDNVIYRASVVDTVPTFNITRK
ncbi:MAG: hypothetical protein IJ488_05570 [Clostridia bacterium]|nr:hypothetical protein [Clostridia bacterium]